VVTRSASIRRSTFSGSKRPSVHTVFMPTARLVITPVNRPERWNSGAENNPQLGREPPGIGLPDSASMIIMRKPLKIADVRNVIRQRWLSSAPLARPVVPLV
jgi:hypothetical protein